MQRIVLMQQSLLNEDSLLRAVASAASRMNTEIAGLFIEDIDLLNLAGMPVASEVCFPSATRREMDVAYLEKLLRRLAGEARRALESVARNTELRVSFRVARGSIFSELVAAASDTDVVITGSLTRARSKPSLTLICGAGIAPQTIADLLRDLAPRISGEITIVLIGRSSLDCKRWEQELRGAIKPDWNPRRMRVVCPKDEQDLERMLRA